MIFSSTKRDYVLWTLGGNFALNRAWSALCCFEMAVSLLITQTSCCIYIPYLFYNIRPYKVYKPRLSCAIFVLLKNSRCTPKSFKSYYFVFCFYQQLCQFIEVNSNNVFAILCFTFYCLPCKLSPLQIITSISFKKTHTHTHKKKKNDFNLRKKKVPQINILSQQPKILQINK